MAVAGWTWRRSRRHSSARTQPLNAAGCSRRSEQPGGQRSRGEQHIGIDPRSSISGPRTAGIGATLPPTLRLLTHLQRRTAPPSSAAQEDTMNHTQEKNAMTALARKWTYRSFHNNPSPVTDNARNGAGSFLRRGERHTCRCAKRHVHQWALTGRGGGLDVAGVTLPATATSPHHRLRPAWHQHGRLGIRR